MSPPSALSAGVDLGGTKIAAVILDEHHRVLGRARMETPQLGGPRKVLDAVAASVLGALQDAGAASIDLDSVGVGSPGAVEATQGTISHASNVSGFDKPVAAAAELQARLGKPVRLGNDVGVAVEAEARLGAGRHLDSFLGVWWGTGVGGGVILNGRRWLGRGHAGEFGHTLVKKNGARCPCGLQGCLEAYAGRLAMEKRARKLVAQGRRTVLFELMGKRAADRLSSGIWGKALEKEDRVAQEITARACEALGLAMASIVNLLDLDGVVLGGGLGGRLGPRCLPQIESALQRQLFVPEKPPKLLLSELGDEAGAIGAALLARSAG
jgi:glucokinase